MKTISKILVGAITAATMGGAILATAGAASAAPTPPTWEPDVNGNGGSISFYDAAGHQVAGGSDLSHLFDYAVASSPEKTGTGTFHKASISFAFPNHSLPTSGWFVQNASASTLYPASPAPGDLASVASNIPVATIGSTEANLTAALGAGTLDTTAGYVNIMQIRLTQSGGNKYYTADIQFNTATNSWQQVYPVLPDPTPTATTLSVSPASPQDQGTSVTLTAHVTASPSAPSNGTVQFFDGSTQIGSDQAFSGSDVSVSTSALSVGTHQLTAKYVPSGITFGTSTSAATSYVIKKVLTATTTTLSVNPGTGKAYDPVTLTATVTPSDAPGKVTFSDSAAGNLGTTAEGTGTFTLTTSTLGQGAHTITATFVPTDQTTYSGSNNTAAPFTLDAPACATCTDQQKFDVNVTPGTLTISTPYDGSTDAKTFHLGDMVLDPNGTKLTASAHFGTVSNPSAGVTITDQRAGDQQWTASVSASDFTKGTDSIDTTQMGFVNVNPAYLPGNALNAATKPVVTNDIGEGAPGLKGGPHQFAQAAHGDGTVYVYGDMTLTAPTSTVAGLYTATVTFTVV